MPSAVEHYQQLLCSWRTILQTCLALEHTITAAPPEVAIGIATARGEITRLKAELRQWGVDVADLADELAIADASRGRPSTQPPHDTSPQSGALHPATAPTIVITRPVQVLNGIAETRREIAQIKRRLHDGRYQSPITRMMHRNCDIEHRLGSEPWRHGEHVFSMNIVNLEQDSIAECENDLPWRWSSTTTTARDRRSFVFPFLLTELTRSLDKTRILYISRIERFFVRRTKKRSIRRIRGTPIFALTA